MLIKEKSERNTLEMVRFAVQHDQPERLQGI